MTLRKTRLPLFLVMFTVMGALPAASVAVPSAIAQEQDENLATGIVSDVLEGDAEDEDDQDAANTAAEDSNQGQDVDQDDTTTFGDDTADLDDVNVAIPIAVPINVQEVVEEPDDGVPPPEEEEDAFFCLAGEVGGFACFESLAECLAAEEIDETEARCEGFETLPAGADLCRFEGGELACED